MDDAERNRRADEIGRTAVVAILLGWFVMFAAYGLCLLSDALPTITFQRTMHRRF